MNTIELKIGTVLMIQSKTCIVKEGRACSKCEYQKLTYHKVSSNGTSLKCGTKYGGNTSDFICSKLSRSDKKDVFFEAI